MADIIRVYLITGFLGSGKTTFLNRIINWFPRNRKLMILMNEFGEIGVDGTCIETDELEMMEISKGSIFCVCVKTDFIKGLYEIAHTIAPDVLVIESTGVANPSDLKRDLKLPIFTDRFQFKEQFCIIDARNFMDAYATFSSVEKQIASSTVFLINKIDQASPEAIDQIEEVIRGLHPSPDFY
jgi:G3E family GTPase